MSYSKSYPLQFTGHGIEYCKIWIINTVLTLMTFGIYSAWAKDGFVAGQQKADTAAGAEIADVFDVNVGIS